MTIIDTIQGQITQTNSLNSTRAGQPALYGDYPAGGDQPASLMGRGRGRNRNSNNAQIAAMAHKVNAWP